MNWVARSALFVGCLTIVACSGGGSQGGKNGKLLGDGGLELLPDGALVLPDGALAGNTGHADGGNAGSSGGSFQTFPPDSGLPFPVNSKGQIMCGTGPCQCDDGLDNDNDGLIDLADPECVASWDNDESSFATGIPGDNRDGACNDCFFDGNSGSGDDGCRSPLSCLTDGTSASGHGSCSSCEQSAMCKNFCEAYTPNGCDCFGCCTVTVGTQTKSFLLASGCSIDGSTATGCTACVPNPSCNNPCGRCELCPGKTLADLPADCASPTSGGSDGGTGTSSDSGTPKPAYTCDNHEQVCGSGLPGCPSGSLCQFGCCILAPTVL